MNRSLLILSNIVEVNDSLSRRFKLDRLPFSVIGKFDIFHFITIKYFQITLALSYTITIRIINNFSSMKK